MKTILLSILMLTCATSFGQNIFKDDLSTYNTGVQLSGQGTWSNNTLNGGLGSCAGAICSNAKVLLQNISYTGYGSSTKAHELLAGTDNCGRLFTPFTDATGTIYVAFVLNISNTITSPGDFFRTMSGSSANTTFRCYAKAVGGNTFTFGIEKGSSSPTYSAAAYNYNQNHLIVIKYAKFSGTNDDVLSAFIDPVFLNGEPVGPSVTTFNGTDNSASIDRLTFRQGFSTTPSGYAGLVSVARTWVDLTFILANEQFSKYTFTIIATNVNTGVLSIKSNVSLNNATLNIYDIQGRTIDTKNVSLNESLNDVTINPIKNAGVYIVEITSENNQRFTQKIMVK